MSFFLSSVEIGGRWKDESESITIMERSQNETEIDTVVVICLLLAVSLSILASAGNSSTFHSNSTREVAFSYVFGMVNMVIGTSLLTILYPFGKDYEYSGQLTKSGLSAMLIIIVGFYWMRKGARMDGSIRDGPENDEDDSELESISIPIAEPIYAVE